MRANEFIIEEPIKLRGTDPKVKEFIAQVYDRFPQTWQNNHVMPMGGEGDEQQFAMFELVPSFSKRGAVEVKWIQAHPLRQGVGGRAMKILQDMARKAGVSLTLYPWDKGQVSQSKLMKFYKGQGFKPTQKGAKNMYWDPSVNENTTTLNKLYNGNFPDKDESFWDEVSTNEFDNQLKIQLMPKYKLAIMLQGQYRVEHLDEILDMMDDDQKEILKHYMNDPNLSDKIIVLSRDRIIDGNHRALAAALKGVPIHYVDLADDLDEMALSSYQTMGDFDKPGPFRGTDKKLVPHPVNQLKTQKFFEKTPFDFRLFFSNIPGTGKYNEYGPMTTDKIKEVFKDQADQIINGHDNAITVVYVGNSGDAKVMLTPWLMAHRFGHAIQAGTRNSKWSAWTEAEKHFFTRVNALLEEYYGKQSSSRMGVTPTSVKWDMRPEYNALFNAMGTQRSSRSGKIRRPYEFLYELFAQYLGTGHVTLNPLPTNLGYGRKAWGNPTKYMNIKPEYRDENERKNIADSLSRDMELMFDDVLSNAVGQIFVM